MINTERLILEQRDSNHWLIFEQSDNQVLLGTITLLHGFFSTELIPAARGLGVAKEAVVGWLRENRFEQLQARRPQNPESLKFLNAIGFIDVDGIMRQNRPPTESQYMKLNRQFGINITRLKTPYQASACRLEVAENDVFGRPLRLHPDAKKAWHKMQQQAALQGVKLQPVSAYRSPKYQASIIEKKLQKGELLKDILTVNTAPGHSEHHSGCAIDITTENSKPLAIEFEKTKAFKWLTRLASQHNFHLSYPKNNPQGIIYEPWHWCYQKPAKLSND